MANINIDQTSTDAGIDDCSMIFINADVKLGMPMADPAADGLFGWDESAADADHVTFFTAGTGLEFSTTTVQIDSTVTTLTGTQTLTNKTLTAPVLGGSVTGTYTLAGTPTITNPTINAATLSGTIAGAPDFSGAIDFASAGVQFSGMGVFNVQHADYGATGDGATDDRAAIQSAIDAAEAAGGGVVYLPPGTYVVAASSDLGLTIDESNVWLVGAGINQTTIKLDDSASLTTSLQFIYVRGWLATGAVGLNNKVCDLTVDGNASNQAYTGKSSVSAVHVAQCERSSIERVYVKDWLGNYSAGVTVEGTPIILNDSFHSFIKDCFVESATDCVGIQIGGQTQTSSKWNRITNCYVKDVTGGATSTGIALWQGTECGIYNSSVEACGVGLHVEDALGSIINGNFVDVTDKSGIQIANSVHGVCTGNVVRNPGQADSGANACGINIFGLVANGDATEHWLVDGNLVYDDQAGVETMDYGIYEQQDSDNNVISNNVSEGAAVTAFTRTGSTTRYFGNVDPGSAEFETNLAVTVDAEGGDGTSSSRAQQLNIHGVTDANLKLEVGLDTTGEFGLVQAVNEGTGFLPVILAQSSAGTVGIGAFASGDLPAEILDVKGNIKTSGYADLVEISTPSDPSSGAGRLYAATDGTLHYINDASLDIELGVAGGGGLANIVEDVTPQIGGTAGLDMQGQDILSGGVIFMTEQAAAEADVAGDGQLWIKTATPNQFWFTDDAGTDAQVSLAGHSHTESDISDLQSYLVNVVEDTTPQLGGMLDVNGNGFGDGTLELLSFSETGSAVNEFTIANAATGNDPVLSATGDDAAVGIVLTPKGTGNVTLGTMVFDSDQTIGAGQDNYVLTYDNGTGFISLEASAGGGLSNVVDDTTPQIGGTAGLDMQGQDITSGGVVFLTEQAAAEADVAGQGQLWVQTATPNVLMFTDDAGTDHTISAGIEVTITSIADDEILQWDAGGSVFENQTLTEAGIADLNLSNITATAVPVTLSSDTDITDDLGTGDIRWKDIHAATLNAGLTAADTLILRGRDVDGAAYVDVLTITSANTVTADLNAITTIGTNAILDSTWTGSANVVTLGTITTGTWTGTDIAVADGGTGASDAPTALSNLGGIGSVVADTSPQLGAMLDVNTFGLGDGTLELLLFSETGSAVNEFTIANAATGNAPVLSATGDDAAIGITLSPKGTGNVTLGTMVFDSDQTIGAGQDNYILTYDNGTGFISLEAASGSGANTALSNLAAVAVSESLTSDTDITDDLGTGDIRWRDIHAETLNAGLTAADTLKLRGRDVDGATYVDILTITSANTVTADLSATVTIGTNAILDSTWTGSANIATVGTITSGVWTGTDIAVADGGTGASDAPTALSNLGGIGAVVSDTAPQLGGMLDVNAQAIGDGTRELIVFIEDASAVNEITIENEATGNPPKIRASGDDADINLDLIAKGTGVVLANSVEVVTLTASQTLTTKILTDPTINAATLSGTIAGTPTYSGGINISASQSYDVAGTAILSDAAGTMTLSNVDGLDATTTTTMEAAMETAIDTLANLTSVQGLTVTLADAGADAILGWDDTAGAYENLTQAEVLAVIGSAAEGAQGVVELATATEINTGTDATRAVAVDQYQASNRNLRYISPILVEPGTDVATATVIAQWVAPFPGDIIQDDSFPDQLAAYTTTAGITGTMVVDIHKNGTTIMGTNKLDIETNEEDSTTATTQPDLTVTTFVAGDIFTWEIDAIHSGTAAKGCHCNMTVRPT